MTCEKGRWFSPGTPVSFTNKTDRHDITEMLLIESGVKHHKLKQHSHQTGSTDMKKVNTVMV